MLVPCIGPVNGDFVLLLCVSCLLWLRMFVPCVCSVCLFPVLVSCLDHVLFSVGCVCWVQVFVSCIDCVTGFSMMASCFGPVCLFLVLVPCVYSRCVDVSFVGLCLCSLC